MSDYYDNVDYPVDDNPLWRLFERNYNKFYLEIEPLEPFMDLIPKKIHQVWVGSPMPAKYDRLRRTWADTHPDWEYRLWTDDDVDSFNMTNRKLFDTIENKGAKADILRYEIINRYGGIYADTDFLCVKPFDDFLSLDFFGGSGWTNNPCTFNGLFGATSGHPILKQVINALSEKVIKPHNRLDEIHGLTGPDFFSDIVTKYMCHSNDRIVIFPKNYFYPFPPELRFKQDLELAKTYIKPTTYAIHLWHTSWQT